MKRDQSQTERVGLREAARLTLRGYHEIWKLSPATLISTIAYGSAAGLSPYPSIYLSARILNEIAGARDPQVLTKLILITLSVTALMTLLTAAAKHWANTYGENFYLASDRTFSEKFLSMDFCVMDDSLTHERYQHLRQVSIWGGWGLRALYSECEDAVKSLMSIAGAIALTVTLFTLKVPEDGGMLTLLNHPALMSAVVAVMLGITLIAPMFKNRADHLVLQEAENAKMGNRKFSVFGFMGYQNRRALDIRIYRQDQYVEQMLLGDAPFSRKGGMALLAKGRLGAMHAASGAASQVLTGIAYLFVCLKAWGGAFGVGLVTQYIASITTLSKGVASLVSILGTFRNNAPFLRSTFEFLDMPNIMYQGSLTIEKRSDRRYEIEFRNVSFQYPASDAYALRNISLKFNVGERLAVVGMNGSGKTTFIKLLCRLYDPTEGEILLNGIDIRKYDYREYMSIYSVVFQDFKLFAYPLGQVVASSERYDADKVRQCLVAAGFGARLETLPLGLETSLYKRLDKQGVEVSGGEAQKIALARALYSDAAFIILDEPTAALDPVAEFEVYSRMNEIVGDKSAVFISHRLSSCRFCHDIVVFHKGQIIQRGSHEALVSDEAGKYFELWGAQAQYYGRSASRAGTCVPPVCPPLGR